MAHATPPAPVLELGARVVESLEAENFSYLNSWGGERKRRVTVVRRRARSALHQRVVSQSKESAAQKEVNMETLDQDKHLSIAFGSPVRLAREDEKCSCGTSAWVLFIFEDGAEIPWCGRNES